MADATNPIADVVSELAPNGVLRAAVNLANFLLVTGSSPEGEPRGVSPSMARAVADKLGVAVEYITYPRPDAIADDAGHDKWDIALIAADPTRATQIAFTSAYSEIESTYLVPAGSPVKSMADIDRPGIRIAVAAGSAYELWLNRNIRHAELVRASTIDESYEVFVAQGLDALSGLKPRLLADVQKLPGARLLDGNFAAVQQAIGTPRANERAAAFLTRFVEDAKQSGMVAGFIAQHNVQGLSVAPRSA